MATNPMHQFNVYRIGPEIKVGEIDISFTNASLFMLISSLAILIVLNIGTKKNSLISVLGGGDTLAAINKINEKLSFTHLSTAGGAFLEYLEGKDLPGLKVLK